MAGFQHSLDRAIVRVDVTESKRTTPVRAAYKRDSTFRVGELVAIATWWCFLVLFPALWVASR